MAYVWQYCDCGHPDDDHRTSGACRAADAYGYPCECRAFDDGHPTPITLDDGAPMDFGAALTALRAGEKVSRTGWNGAHMFIVLQAGYPDGIPINANTAAATGIAEGTVCRFRPYLMMFTVQGDFVPWVASQSDVLAVDWEIAL